jgi:hypothetical protein
MEMIIPEIATPRMNVVLATTKPLSKAQTRQRGSISLVDERHGGSR